jgi:enterochelin esterase family protein
VASFSAGGMSDQFAVDFPQLTAADANAKLHLLWVACGTDDRLITINRNMVSWFKEKGIRVTQVETPGMHTWMVWRNNLINLSPVLFREHMVHAQPTFVNEK